MTIISEAGSKKAKAISPTDRCSSKREVNAREENSNVMELVDRAVRNREHSMNVLLRNCTPFGIQ